jgi:DNA-binding transcriptional regulator GbsR (MarR family)
MAYLLLMPKPISLDEIAEGLDISKASAWGATKRLEQVHQIERLGEAGTQRALFSPIHDYSRSLFNYSRLLHRSSGLLKEVAGCVDSSVVARRLRERSRAFLSVHEAIEGAVADLKVDRRRAASE